MLSKASARGFCSSWMSVLSPNFLLQKFQVSSYECINGLGKWFVSTWKWGRRFLVLTAWLTKQGCTLWTLGALLGVAVWWMKQSNFPGAFQVSDGRNHLSSQANRNLTLVASVFNRIYAVWVIEITTSIKNRNTVCLLTQSPLDSFSQHFKGLICPIIIEEMSYW